MVNLLKIWEPWQTWLKIAARSSWSLISSTSRYVSLLVPVNINHSCFSFGFIVFQLLVLANSKYCTFMYHQPKQWQKKFFNLNNLGSDEVVHFIPIWFQLTEATPFCYLRVPHCSPSSFFFSDVFACILNFY